jgi:CDP-paratose synthetase
MEVVESNLTFALRVLETAILFNTATFFNTDTLLPKFLNNYSLSKHQFTEWLKQLSEKIQCINFRIEHIYGPKDDKTKFVPWLLDQMINSREEIKLTLGLQKRDFVYIDDVVSAYMLLLNQTGTLPIWNEFDVGTNQLVTIKEFILSLQTIVKISLNINVEGRLNFGAIPYRAREIMEPVVNNFALVQAGWQPKMTLTDGLQEVLKELQ